MQLVYYPDERLSRVCIPAQEFSELGVAKRATVRDRRIKLSVDMWKIMEDNNGVGLAAPQVGLNHRMFVWRYNHANCAVWNPILTWLEGEEEAVEGCLSLPGISVVVKRAKASTLSGTGEDGSPFCMIGNSILTRIWQHEIDHLDGKLIIDNMNRNETISNRKALKRLRKKTVS